MAGSRDSMFYRLTGSSIVSNSNYSATSLILFLVLTSLSASKSKKSVILQYYHRDMVHRKFSSQLGSAKFAVVENQTRRTTFLKQQFPLHIKNSLKTLQLCGARCKYSTHAVIWSICGWINNFKINRTSSQMICGWHFRFYLGGEIRYGVRALFVRWQKRTGKRRVVECVQPKVERS